MHVTEHRALWETSMLQVGKGVVKGRGKGKLGYHNHYGFLTQYMNDKLKDFPVVSMTFAMCNYFIGI